MKTAIWNADKIRAEMKRTKKPFVLGGIKGFVDLKNASRLTGDYTVVETKFEVMVQDNYLRKEK